MSLVDLGVVYDVRVDGDRIEIDLTLTYSGCPARDYIVRDIEEAAQAVEGVASADVSVVYTPQWSHDRITEQGREALREHGLAVPGDGDR